MDKLLSRSEFNFEVFARSNLACVFCDKPAIDSHHILDRKLFSDGGYYLNNGAAVCETHHWQCETTQLTVEQVRNTCKISIKILPPGFQADKI